MRIQRSGLVTTYELSPGDRVELDCVAGDTFTCHGGDNPTTEVLKGSPQLVMSSGSLVVVAKGRYALANPATSMKVAKFKVTKRGSRHADVTKAGIQ